MKEFSEVVVGDNLYVFVNDLNYVFTENVRKVVVDKYNDFYDIINIHPLFSNNGAYMTLSNASSAYSTYINKTGEYDSIVFTTKYEMERYIKKIAMKCSRKSFELSELLYNI